MHLQENGFDAFLMQTELVDHGGTWHRVFLGRYVDEQKAQEAAHLARSEYQHCQSPNDAPLAGPISSTPALLQRTCVAPNSA